MRGLKGKTAIVTGAGQGIGRAIVERLLDEGVKVLAVDLRVDGLRELARPRTELETLPLDLTREDAPATVIDKCLEAFSAIDILVNNVGIGNAPSLRDTTDEMFDRLIAVNLRIAFRLSRECLDQLRKSGGVIVNTASSVALAGYRGSAAYAASKGGMIALTRNIAAEYGSFGVRANAVAPGVIETPLTADRLNTSGFYANVVGTMPLGRVGQPEDVAAAVAFLSSEDARMINGQVVAIDGGQTSSVFLSDDILAAWQEASKR